MRRQIMAVAMSVGAAPAAAQMSALPDEIASSSALTSAARTLAKEGKDGVVIRDLLDKPIVGEGGSEIGSVEDFAVVPGGLAAVIVRTSDGGRLAVPFNAVKVGSAARQAPLEVPSVGSEITGMAALSSLADVLSR